MGFPTRQSDVEEADFEVMNFSYWTVRQLLSPKVQVPLHHDIDLQCLKQLILIVGIMFRATHLHLSMGSHHVITTEVTSQLCLLTLGSCQGRFFVSSLFPYSSRG